MKKVLFFIIFVFSLVFILSKLTHSLPLFEDDEIDDMGRLKGTIYHVDLSKGIVLEINEKVTKRCHREGWMFNPECCCTHNWCHPVNCERIKPNGDETFTVELFPGDLPKVNYHVIWEVITKDKLQNSPDADRGICYVCASGKNLSCVLYVPGGIM